MKPLIHFSLILSLLLILYSEKGNGNSLDLAPFILTKCGRNSSSKMVHLANFAPVVCRRDTSDAECQSDCEFILGEFRERCNFTSQTLDIIADSFNLPKSCFQSANHYVEDLEKMKPKQDCQDGTIKVTPGDYISKPCSEVIGKSFEGNAIYLCSKAGNFLVDVESCKVKGINPSSFSDINHSDKKNSSTSSSVSEILGDVVKHIESIEEFGKVLNSVGLKKLSKFVSTVGQFLGPIGIAFSVFSSVVGSFIPEVNEEHQELLRKLDQLDKKLEDVSERIVDLSNHVTKKLFETEFREHRMKLYYVEHDIKVFVENPSNYTKLLLVERCKSNKALELMIWFDEILKDIASEDFGQMYEFDRNIYREGFAQPAMAYLIRAMSAQIKCAGMLGAEKNDIDMTAASLKFISEAVVDKLNYIYEQYLPDYAISRTLEKDLKNLIDQNEGLSKKDLSDTVYSELNRKYDYFKWGVTVYTFVSGTDLHRQLSTCMKCVGRKSAGMFSVCRGKNCLNVMYTDNPLSSAFPNSLEIKRLANLDNDWNQDLQAKIKNLSNWRLMNLLIVDKSLNVESTLNTNYVYTQEVQVWHYERKFLFWKKQVFRTIIITFTYR